MFRPEINLNAIHCTDEVDSIGNCRGRIRTRLQSKRVLNQNLNKPKHPSNQNKSTLSSSDAYAEQCSTIDLPVKCINKLSPDRRSTSNRCSNGFNNMKRIKSHHSMQSHRFICPLAQIKSYTHLSSYLLKSSIPFSPFKSSTYLRKATKPNEFTSKRIKDKKFNLSISLASYSIIILVCLIQLLAGSPTVLAASTAFDYQNNNNQPDNSNSIVYQDASGGVSDLHIECNSNMIVLVLNTQNEQFNGLIYPKGLSKNSTCMVEYNNQIAGNITYILPLRSCNTMSSDVDDGVEYYNTIVVQPHRSLITNQGKGYHIRCRYQTKEKSITNFFNVTTIGNVPITASAPIPLCSMKIMFAEDAETEIFVAENVKIGDKLKLEIKIEEQPVYGMKVTNCLVRDGLNWAEQALLSDDGCPIDEEILGQFKYNKNLTKAQVSFQAHKFPYTSSVYYQCNVRLCLKQTGGCGDTPPNCDQNRRNFRKRRDLNKPSIAAALRTDEIKELSVEVYSGLYVNEADSEEGNLLPLNKKIVSEQEFCISMRKFLIGVLIASMLLMTAVVLLVACILQRRRRRKHISTTCSSIYSGPYSNRGFLS